MYVYYSAMPSVLEHVWRCAAAGFIVSLLLCGPLFAFAQIDEQGIDETRGEVWRRYDGALRDALASLPQQPVTSFPIPVLFGVAVSDLAPNFGEMRGGGTRTHEGLDIMAPRGTPVASPTDAIVLRTGDGSSSGLVVYTANPGGETFVYMHLDKIAEGLTQGKRIPRGHIIGFVGDTGNAKGAGTHLHFEVRKNGATDPFPRLAHTFSAEERSSIMQQLFASVADPTSLAQYLAAAIPNTLHELSRTGVTLPRALADALPANISVPPISTAVQAVNPASAVGTAGEDVEFGATGAAVIALQQALIAKNTGPAAAYLARSGATGYFGTATKNALIEFQKASGIAPAAGYYGPRTRAALSGAAAISAAASRPAPTTFSRDLEQGMEGEDVRELQKMLNAAGFTIAAAGDGSPGNESTYFGARTKAALIAFQKEKGIVPAAGYFGTRTRVALGL